LDCPQAILGEARMSSRFEAAGQEFGPNRGGGRVLYPSLSAARLVSTDFSVAQDETRIEPDRAVNHIGRKAVVRE
jgi:hypothetical protein